MQRQIPILIVFFSGLIMLLDYFFPKIPYLHGTREIFLNWGRIALSGAMILGILNLLLTHLKKVSLQNKGWIFSLILLLSFGITLYFALPYKTVVHDGVVSTMKGTDAGTVGYKIFMNVYTPLSASIFSLVAFFIVSAAFRAFRAKNIEATLLLVSATLVMIGSIPFGDSLFAFLGLNAIFGTYNFSWLSNQIQQIPMAAAQRAINFGVSFGVIFISIKILAGLDRSYFGGE